MWEIYVEEENHVTLNKAKITENFIQFVDLDISLFEDILCTCIYHTCLHKRDKFSFPIFNFPFLALSYVNFPHICNSLSNLKNDHNPTIIAKLLHHFRKLLQT